MPCRCIIIDDDEVDRLTVLSFAKRCPELEVAGVFGKAEDAGALIEAGGIDVLFLDIDMPGLSGLELRRLYPEVPVCIYITSHPEHAIESFELDTLDFLVKPVKFDRFAHAVERIANFMEMRHKASLFEASVGGDAIYLKEGRGQVKVKMHDILYLEALKDYTLVVTPQKRHCVLSNLGTLLRDGNFASFVRIHRSYAVQKEFIQKISSAEVVLNNNITLPLGRSFRPALDLIFT